MGDFLGTNGGQYRQLKKISIKSKRTENPQNTQKDFKENTQNHTYTS